MTAAPGSLAQVVDAMTRLKTLAGARPFLLVGDSKLVRRGNLVAMNRARVRFIAPAGKTYVGAKTLRGLDHALATPVDDVSTTSPNATRDNPPSSAAATRSSKGPSRWAANAQTTQT